MAAKRASDYSANLSTKLVLLPACTRRSLRQHGAGAKKKSSIKEMIVEGYYRMLYPIKR